MSASDVEEKPSTTSQAPLFDVNDESIAPIENYRFQRTSRNRVKLYMLCEQRAWNDRGTGHVVCVLARNPPGHILVVRLESEEENVLQSRIHPDTVYQKQQETLIVWSDSEACDLALSFQEKAGCDEIWNRICVVQGRNPHQCDEEEDGDGNGAGAGGSGGADDEEPNGLGAGGGGVLGRNRRDGSPPLRGAGVGGVLLPPPKASRLAEIEATLNSCTSSLAMRKTVANFIENTDYVSRLCETFRMVEDLEDLDSLVILHQCIKHLFHINLNPVIEQLLADENLRDVVGMLEWDPAHLTEDKQPLHRHREFLFEKAHFREVLPLHDVELKSKIQLVFRAQYVLDVCLPAPSIFEDNPLSILQSHLYLARNDIVSSLLHDRSFVRDFFAQLKNPRVDSTRRRDLIGFLRELCLLSQEMTASGPKFRDNFFGALMTNDVLAAVEPCLDSADEKVRSLCVEVLGMLVDHAAQPVRDFLVRDTRSKRADELVICKLLRHMHSEREPEPVAAILRQLLNPDTMQGGPGGGGPMGGGLGGGPLARGMSRFSSPVTDRSEFLDFFYTHALPALIQPILDNTKAYRLQCDSLWWCQLACAVVRIVCFCADQHALAMRKFIIARDLLNRVLVLLSSRHHFLALAALKLLRCVLGRGDEFYNRYLVREHVLDRVVTAFRSNGHRNNLLNSAILELFEHIRTEDMRSLIAYTIENHWSAFENATYTNVFRALKTRYEQHQHRDETSSTTASSRGGAGTGGPGSVTGGSQRGVDYDDDRNSDQWFDDDDEEEEQQQQQQQQNLSGSLSSSGNENDPPSAPSPINSPQSPSSSLATRKNGIEPAFSSSPPPPKMRRRADDDDDDMFSAATTSASGGQQQPIQLQQQQQQRIVIRVGSTGAPSPSTTPPPATPPTTRTGAGSSRSGSMSPPLLHQQQRSPASPSQLDNGGLMASSQPLRSRSPSPSTSSSVSSGQRPVAVVAPRRPSTSPTGSLVEYDDSDSDGDGSESAAAAAAAAAAAHSDGAANAVDSPPVESTLNGGVDVTQPTAGPDDPAHSPPPNERGRASAVHESRKRPSDPDGSPDAASAKKARPPRTDHPADQQPPSLPVL